MSLIFFFSFNAMYQLQDGEMVLNTTVKRCRGHNLSTRIFSFSHLLPFHLSVVDGIRRCKHDGLDNTCHPMRKCGQYSFCVGST